MSAEGPRLLQFLQDSDLGTSTVSSPTVKQNPGNPAYLRDPRVWQVGVRSTCFPTLGPKESFETGKPPTFAFNSGSPFLGGEMSKELEARRSHLLSLRISAGYSLPFFPSLLFPFLLAPSSPA